MDFKFIYIRDYLIKKEVIDYVIIIDDDQIFDIDWVKKYMKKKNLNNMLYGTVNIR